MLNQHALSEWRNELNGILLVFSLTPNFVNEKVDLKEDC